MTTGECELKRSAPLPVVPHQSPAKDGSGNCHQGRSGKRICRPDVTRRRDASRSNPEPGSDGPHARPNSASSFSSPARFISVRRTPCGQVPSTSVHSARAPFRGEDRLPSADCSPYFSSSLTLSIRGAVSPARHVLTRPRPHPVSTWARR